MKQGDIVPARPVGRPSKFNLDKVEKLIAAFNNGLNIEEACNYAEIDKGTYYTWLEKNKYFSTQMEIARNAPNVKAKENITKALNAGDTNISRWWLERKDPEFKARSELDLNHGMQQTTEDKIKDFLNDTNDGAYDDQRAEPTTALEAGSGSEVAEPTPDIS